jgi:phage-related protein
MVAFPAVSAPVAGSSVSPEVRVLKASFGDGYSQRAADGINNVVDKYQLTWENVDRSEANVIDNFLRARAGVEFFTYTMPGQTTPRKWLCEQWTRNHITAVLDTVQATFIECFDLG